MGVEREGSGKVRNQENLKQDTASLLRTLLDHTKGLPPLPDNCFITVDLTYYDEMVPIDYQPEGFKESTIFQVPSGENFQKYRRWLGDAVSYGICSFTYIILVLIKP